MARPEKQVTAWLSAAERSEFERYATTFHLDAAGLLALLFAREMRVGRLSALLVEDVAPEGLRESKVTFRPGTDAHAAIGSFARHGGLPVSQAGAVIVRAELRERWLERACATRFESLDVD